MSRPSPVVPAPLTRVAILFLPDRANDWLRFGEPAAQRIIDRRRSAADFAPGAVFGFIRWRANGFGTELWRAYVLRAGAPGDALRIIPGVAPGAHMLVSTATEQRVRRLLALIDAIEAADLQPSAAPEHYWRVVQNRLEARLPLRVYGADKQSVSTARELAP